MSTPQRPDVESVCRWAVEVEDDAIVKLCNYILHLESQLAGRPSDAEILAMLKQCRSHCRDLAENFDCDSDGHRYNTYCRKCEAAEHLKELDSLLAKLNQEPKP